MAADSITELCQRLSRRTRSINGPLATPDNIVTLHPCAIPIDAALSQYETALALNLFTLKASEPQQQCVVESSMGCSSGYGVYLGIRTAWRTRSAARR